MTLEYDRDALIRLVCALIWFLMSLALSVEICALIGWVIGHPIVGAWCGVLLNGLFWIWVIYDGSES